MFLISSCGFKPVYARQDSELVNKLASVRVEPIAGRSGQILRFKLDDLLDPTLSSEAPDYALRVQLSEELRELGIQGDLRVTRYDVVMVAKYQLIKIDENRLITEGTSRLKSSYNRTASEFSTFVAEEDAREKASEELAEDLKSRLVAYFAGN